MPTLCPRATLLCCKHQLAVPACSNTEMARVRHVLTALFRLSARTLPAANPRICPIAPTDRPLCPLRQTRPLHPSTSRGARQTSPPSLRPPAKYRQHCQHRQLICDCRTSPQLSSADCRKQWEVSACALQGCSNIDASGAPSTAYHHYIYYINPGSSPPRARRLPRVLSLNNSCLFLPHSSP